MSYSINEHKHRFSAWAAGRGAARGKRGFTVEKTRLILEGAQLNQLLLGPSQLPDPGSIDVEHRQWRRDVISVARREGLDLMHGVAAKLINIYLKAGLVCGGHEVDARVQALHPPIDSLLLKELCRQDVGGLSRLWAHAGDRGWSNFSSGDYEEVIASIRMALGPDVPWEIEQYWRGYQ